jgi:acyl carrier protein
MSDGIRDSVVNALHQMNYDVSDVTGQTVLGPAGLDLESLAVAELAARVEDAYGVRFSDEELERFATLTLDEFATEVSARMTPAMAAGKPE